jgi:putative membrane protein
MAAVIAFGFGAAGARGPECEGVEQPDMTAFGFVAPAPRLISDRSFVRKAADRNMMEVALGEMAEERAASPDVKQFGQMMAREHTLADNQLLEIAKKDNLEVPVDMDREDHEIHLHLSGLKGHDFDRAYMNQVINNHKDDLKLFEQMANEGANADLRNYARKSLANLREHLRMAQEIYSRIT